MHLEATTVSIFDRFGFVDAILKSFEQNKDGNVVFCFVSLTFSKNKVRDCIGYCKILALEPV